MISFDKRSVSGADADTHDQGSREISVPEIAGGMNDQISPDDLDMLQGIIDRVCTCCSIPRHGKRADRLARHLTDRFRKGMSDEGRAVRDRHVAGVALFRSTPLGRLNAEPAKACRGLQSLPTR